VCGSQIEFVDTPNGVPTDGLATAATAPPLAAVRSDPTISTWTVVSETAITALFDSRPQPFARFPVLTNYDIRKVIGTGGMGVVYQAVQKRVARTVALKVVQGLSATDWRQRVRFANEALALGRLKHPNVVTVYEVGEENSTPFFSMEYVPGGTLADRVRNDQRVPAKEAAELIAAAAEGVAAAHQVGVLHRDLKPSNILVTADGTVKVSDFGLARLLDRDDGPTHSGMLVGTPSYMAPEQAGGKMAEVTPATDVYGLGATLYHLLTGRPPFKEGSPIGTAMRVLNEPLPAPRTLCPDIDPVLEAIVLKAMAKASAERYQSARALAADLTAWRQGKPTSVRPPTRTEKVRYWLRRHRMRLAAGVLLPLLAVAVAIAKRENDPVRQIKQTLERGDKVVIVPEIGPLKWHRWELDEVTLHAPIDSDGAAGFQTYTHSLLELVPDTMTDRYRVSVELRHVNGQHHDSRVGIYLGPINAWGPNGVRTGRWIGFDYTEFPPTSPAQEPACGYFRAYDWTTTQFPDRAWLDNDISLRDFIFEPASSVPIPWRKIVIDVSPSAVITYWQRPDGNLVPAFTQTITDINLATARLRTARRQNGIDLPISEWSPRGPVGVYAINAAVAFRNIVIDPNPTDPLP
jgi:serine/threonine protein kinase